MRNKQILMVILWVLCITGGACYGQTASQIEEKYGKPISSYAVSEHIWMSPAFADDGQMCRASFYHRHISAGTIYLSNDLPLSELKDVVNQLVPIQKRGKKGELFGISLITGPSADTIFDYEKVTFYFSWSTHFRPSEKGAETSGQTKKADKGANSDEIFDSPSVLDAETVTIKWNDRTCAKK